MIHNLPPGFEDLEIHIQDLLVEVRSTKAKLDEASKEISTIKGTKSVNIPSGIVQAFAGDNTSLPSDWLICDGSAVSRVTYSTLFSIIGESYGAGDGSATFNLPDLRGEFVRGLDAGRGVDTGRTLGSSQVDALENHNHYLAGAFDDNTSDGGSSLFDDSTAVRIDDLRDVNRQTGKVLAGSATVSTETRPRNVAMNYIIKV